MSTSAKPVHIAEMRFVRSTAAQAVWMIELSDARVYEVHAYPHSDRLFVLRSFGVRKYPVNVVRAPKVHALFRETVWADANKRGLLVGPC